MSDSERKMYIMFFFFLPLADGVVNTGVRAQPSKTTWETRQSIGWTGWTTSWSGL